MAGKQRIKGQEIQIVYTSPDGVEEAFGPALSAEFTLDVELLREQYLGQSADSFDDIYHGVTGSVEHDINSVAYLKFTEKVQDRAERRSPASGQFSLTVTLNFPDGLKAKVTMEDLFFGELPLKFGSRAAYGRATTNFGCERMRRVL